MLSCHKKKPKIKVVKYCLCIKWMSEILSLGTEDSSKCIGFVTRGKYKAFQEHVLESIWWLSIIRFALWQLCGFPTSFLFNITTSPEKWIYMQLCTFRCRFWKGLSIYVILYCNMFWISSSSSKLEHFNTGELAVVRVVGFFLPKYKNFIKATICDKSLYKMTIFWLHFFGALV